MKRVCDLTGEGDAQVVRFSVDDQTWEIDLAEVGAKQLHEALRPFTDVARLVEPAPVMAAEPGDPGPLVVGEGVTVKRGSGLPAHTLTPEERRACRAWARRFPKKVAGVTVGTSGSLPASVVDAWIVAGKPVLS